MRQLSFSMANSYFTILILMIAQMAAQTKGMTHPSYFMSANEGQMVFDEQGEGRENLPRI
jgi:hypothetical protein